MIAFVEEQRDALGGKPICRQLSIAPSTFHDHLTKRANPDLLSDWAKRDVEIYQFAPKNLIAIKHATIEKVTP